MIEDLIYKEIVLVTCKHFIGTTPEAQSFLSKQQWAQSDRVHRKHYAAHGAGEHRSKFADKW